MINLIYFYLYIFASDPGIICRLSFNYMGHQNTQYPGHMIDLETDQQGHSHLHPEPGLFYGSVANFPQPSVHTVVPPGNACNFNFNHMPEHHDGALFYGMMQYNGVQHPSSNLDLSVGASSGHYNPYMVPPSSIRDFPMPINYGAHDHLSLSGTQGIVGIPTDGFGRNIPYMDDVRGSFKRKNAEGLPVNYQYHNASAGSSSSVAPTTVRPVESDVTLTDAATFLPPEYATNDPTPMVESGSHRSVRNRPGMIASESRAAQNAGHLFQGNYVTRPVHLPGNPWMDMHLSANSGDIGTYAWNQAPSLPYMHANVNGGCLEAGNRGVQGYQLTTSSGSSNSFLPPPIPQGHPNLHHHPQPPMQGVRAYNTNLPSQVGTSSRRISTISSSNSGINPFQDAVEAGPTFLAPVPPTGFRLHQPHRREVMLDLNTRHRNLPHLRLLPEDEVAILEIPGYNEAGDSVDHHRDMRLDIDHMSYEELLALGEQIGSVVTGLSEEAIRRNLKVGTFGSSATCAEQEIKFCVICQTDYEEQEKMGILDCGHEYHRDCIKKWLLMKNSCPICKSTALTHVREDL
ncbi:probable E3 ubiquitin- ligase HIP1 [Olea europaea subsp. europaea]|uniref:RING-type E3 ubiquitin transferase n=1 Tax=Olea europaea subsp. europaea TaxID=158383 RepID=A0A8S0UL84_OLEEU|nr:probable E3 ubiquitin- ligase HIP1 [Olea europaea subsp. europaea]